MHNATSESLIQTSDLPKELKLESLVQLTVLF